MSETTRRYVDMFWQLLDEILNAVLFVLIGMELLIIAFTGPLLLAGVHRDRDHAVCPMADRGTAREAASASASGCRTDPPRC